MKSACIDKEIYLIRECDGESYHDFSSRILSFIDDNVLPRDPQLCKVVLTTQPPPRGVIPYKKKKVASISVGGGPSQGNGYWSGLFSGCSGLFGGYRVECAVPVSYNREWSEGEMTPGAGLLTLFRQKKGIDRETFLDRWHNSHTPLSLRVHPLWNYDRNVVLSHTVPDSHDYHGIVEELVRDPKDLISPRKFFGGFPKMIGHMVEVWRDISSFIENETTEPYYVNEYSFIQ